MSDAQLEVFSATMQREYFQEASKNLVYAELLFLCILSISSQFQRTCIGYMMDFPIPGDLSPQEAKFYGIARDVDDLTMENYAFMQGNGMQLMFAFVMLISGGLSDWMNRKALLLGTFFVQTFCTFLNAYCDNFQQMLTLRILIGVLNAVSGPCAYGLLSDWVPPEQRTMAYALYALGVQFGQPLSELNNPLIAELGWRDSFNFLALQGFVVLVLCVLIFEEPERGRFDIQHSVANEGTMRGGEHSIDGGIGYDLTMAATHK